MQPPDSHRIDLRRIVGGNCNNNLEEDDGPTCPSVPDDRGRASIPNLLDNETLDEYERLHGPVTVDTVLNFVSAAELEDEEREKRKNKRNRRRKKKLKKLLLYSIPRAEEMARALNIALHNHPPQP